MLVTGTDTAVGKTYVCEWLIRTLRAQGAAVGAYKPCCSGAVVNEVGQSRWEDIDRLCAALDRPDWSERVCQHRFSAPLAPPLAAAQEGRTIEPLALTRGLKAWRGEVELLVVEGAGGWLCPMTVTLTLADLAQQWCLPVLVVARVGLGTINHTLLTIESIRRRGLNVVGVILSEASPCTDDPSVLTNAIEIEARSGVPVWGTLGYRQSELQRDGRSVRINWSLLMQPI
jgi:dethiobiotin synthetase